MNKDSALGSVFSVPSVANTFRIYYFGTGSLSSAKFPQTSLLHPWTLARLSFSLASRSERDLQLFLFLFHGLGSGSLQEIPVVEFKMGPAQVFADFPQLFSDALLFVFRSMIPRKGRKTSTASTMAVAEPLGFSPPG